MRVHGGLVLNPHTGRPDGWQVADVLEARGEAATARLLEQAHALPGIKNYTRNKHYIGGRTAATAATARNVAAAIWNPHTTSRIYLYEVWVAPTTAATINLGLARITARGTATSSVTAAIDHSLERDTAAPSGMILDLTYSAQPTVSASNNAAWSTPAAVGNGVILPFPDPLTIPPGTGFALITTQAVAFPISDVTYVVGD